MNRRLTYLSLICCIGLLSSGCHAKHTPSTSSINPEILGMWKDSSGCRLELSQHQDTLYLVNFSDNHGHHWHDLELKLTKESILTKFKATSAEVPFSGAFSEGFIMIDNQYCHEALHKDAR